MTLRRILELSNQLSGQLNIAKREAWDEKQQKLRESKAEALDGQASKLISSTAVQLKDLVTVAMEKMNKVSQRIEKRSQNLEIQVIDQMKELKKTLSLRQPPIIESGTQVSEANTAARKENVQQEQEHRLPKLATTPAVGQDLSEQFEAKKSQKPTKSEETPANVEIPTVDKHRFLPPK